MWKTSSSFWGGFLLGSTVGAVLLILLGACVALAFQRPLSRMMAAQREANLKAPVLARGEAADLNWSVTDLEGKTQSLSQFSRRPVFLHFWSPACVTCMAEIPSLNRLYASLQDSRVTVVTLVKGEAAEVAREVQALGVQFPVYLEKDARPKVFRAPGTPATFLVDAAGQVVMSHLGGAKWDDPATIAYIKALPVGAEAS